MRKFDTEYRVDKLKEILGNENFFRNDVDIRLHALELASGAIEAAANEARDQIVRAADLELAPRLAELVAILAQYNGNVNAIRDAALVLIRGGVDSSADTLAKIKTLIDGKAAASHSHVVANISGLSAILDDKSNVGHGHDIAAVTNLQNVLNGKAASVHGHVASDINDSTAAGRALLTAASASSQRASLGLGSAATATVAWVNFNGVTGAIRASQGVSSITKFGTGDYGINFTNAMPDTNYCVVAGFKTSDVLPVPVIEFDQAIFAWASGPSQAAIYTGYRNQTTNDRLDPVQVHVAIFR